MVLDPVPTKRILFRLENVKRVGQITNWRTACHRKFKYGRLVGDTSSNKGALSRSENVWISI